MVMIERGREKSNLWFGRFDFIFEKRTNLFIIGWVWVISELDLPRFPNGPGKTHSIRASANEIAIPTSTLSVCDNG